MPDMSIIDTLSEALGNSDDQTPDEIRKELQEEGVDIGTLEKRILKYDKKIREAKAEWNRCESCGHLYSPSWRAPDEIWNKVVGVTDGGELYCVDCFSEIAEQKNINLYWECEVGEFPTIKDLKQKSDIGLTKPKR